VAFLGRNGLIVGRKALAGATGVALVMVALLIILGRTGSAGGGPFSPVPTSGTSKGSPKAPVTIVEYYDFQCHFCQQFELTTAKDLERVYIATGKVRLVYKHFIVFGEESMRAAIASECAAEQGQFWPYHDALVQAQASPSVDDLTADKLKGFAQELGLNTVAFNACLDSERYKDKVMQDIEDGKQAGVGATPVFFINGVEVKGAQPLEVFQGYIEDMLRQSRK
jgi:protein-disulfide isomerase